MTDDRTQREALITKALRATLGKLPSGALRDRTPDEIMEFTSTKMQIEEASILDYDSRVGRRGKIYLGEDFVLEFVWDNALSELVSGLSHCPIVVIDTYRVAPPKE